MKSTLATTSLAIGSVLAPVAACAADSDMDRSKPIVYVKDSVITTKIRTKLAIEQPGSMRDVSVDTDMTGVVWMTGTANTQGEVDQAVAIARGTEGVRSVNSKLTVQKDRGSPNPKRQGPNQR